MSNGEEQVMAVKGERVVLRGVQAIVLDDLSGEDRVRLLDFVAQGAMEDHCRQVWITEGTASGSFDAAIEAHAGKTGEVDNAPGLYRAPKKAAWLEKSPRVIEPPLS